MFLVGKLRSLEEMQTDMKEALSARIAEREALWRAVDFVQDGEDGEGSETDEEERWVGDDLLDAFEKEAEMLRHGMDGVDKEGSNEGD